MRKYGKCEICDEFHWEDRQCPPVFKVRHEEYMGDEPKIFYAYSVRDAALKYAEYYNTNGDYVLMDGSEEVVQVEDDRGTIINFKISAEASIDYSAEEID